MLFYKKQIKDFLLSDTNELIQNLKTENFAKYFKDRV